MGMTSSVIMIEPTKGKLTTANSATIPSGTTEVVTNEAEVEREENVTTSLPSQKALQNAPPQVNPSKNLIFKYFSLYISSHYFINPQYFFIHIEL